LRKPEVLDSTGREWTIERSGAPTKGKNLPQCEKKPGIPGFFTKKPGAKARLFRFIGRKKVQ
jgi:hypothetical protein